jgi:hypothetical protein
VRDGEPRRDAHYRQPWNRVAHRSDVIGTSVRSSAVVT